MTDNSHVDQSSPILVRKASEVLWNYHRLGHSPMKSDGILVFGSNDLRVADHAAHLFHQGMGNWILFSGARGRMTLDWPDTEAATMAARACHLGVPEECVLIENVATNTGENIRFSRELLAAAGLSPLSAIVVQKPYMERRTHAALEVQWPGVRWCVSSPPLDFESYCTGDLSPFLVAEAMVGDFQRILEYPGLGFASEQPVPPEVMEAFLLLRDFGMTSQLR